MIIEGFKSYKDQTIAEPFSEKINTVGEQGVQVSQAWNTQNVADFVCFSVGANGSGKSNFFHGKSACYIGTAFFRNASQQMLKPLISICDLYGQCSCEVCPE